MRIFAALTAALLLLAGCQQAPAPQASAPAKAPPASPATGDSNQGVQNSTALVRGDAKDRFPLDQEQFKAGAMDKTRDEVHAKYGPPDELGDWGAAVGWDGPVSIYRGPFTSASDESANATKAKARVYFRRSGAESVAANVEFTNQ